MGAVDKNAYDTAKLLIENNCNIEIEDHNKYTALFIACNSNSRKVFELLIQSGANLNKTCEYDYTCLMLAAGKNLLKFVKLLVKNGANIEWSSKYGVNALMFACMHSNVEIAKYLIKHNCKIDSKTVDGNTALHGFRNIHVGTSWNDFFGNKNYEKLYRKNGVETFFNGAATSFFISRCIYINLHPKGAIIFLNTIDNMDIFINDSTFRSCYTDYQDLPGGSFYWRSSGSCIQSRNCYYQSWCSKSGQAYGVSVSSNGINHCNFTTLFKIGVDPNKYMFTIGQSYGNVIINNNNQTECKCSLVAGFGTTSNFFSMEFSNYKNIFNGNPNLERRGIFEIMVLKSNSYVQNNNFLNNTVPYTIFYHQSNFTSIYKSCVFKDNKCKYLLDCGNTKKLTIANMNISNTNLIYGNPIYSNTYRAQIAENEIMKLEFEVCLRTFYKIDMMFPFANFVKFCHLMLD